MAELCELAPLIGIQVEPDKSVSDHEFDRVNALNGVEDDPLWIEKFVWLSLYESARLSIANNALIVFS